MRQLGARSRLVGKQEQETDFLARDLEEAVAYKPTEGDAGESVIDLTATSDRNQHRPSRSFHRVETNVAYFLFTLSTLGN